MNPIFKFYFLLLICPLMAVSQITFTSNCLAHDSIMKQYERDAGRLALRHTQKVGSTYVDSLTIERSLKQKYLNALIAVYNCTALPVRDSLIQILNIHSYPNPEVNALNVKASPLLPWMQELKSSSNPTSNVTVNDLIIRYSMQFTYFQSIGYDAVIFSTDTTLNMSRMGQIFMTLPGVISATPENGFDDSKNISDSLHTTFVELNYSIGWGSCFDGCDRRHYWNVNVFPDCTVEYTGENGELLYLKLNENKWDEGRLTLSPNPSADVIKIASKRSNHSIYHMHVLDNFGRQVMKESVFVIPGDINVRAIPTGVYLVQIWNDDTFASARFVKE